MDYFTFVALFKDCWDELMRDPVSELTICERGRVKMGNINRPEVVEVALCRNRKIFRFLG